MRLPDDGLGFQGGFRRCHVGFLIRLLSRGPAGRVQHQGQRRAFVGGGDTCFQMDTHFLRGCSEEETPGRVRSPRGAPQGSRSMWGLRAPPTPGTRHTVLLPPAPSPTPSADR